MKSLNTPFIKLTIILVFGITSGFHPQVTFLTAFILTGLTFTGFLFFYARSRIIFPEDGWFGSSVYFLFFSIGLLVTQLHLPQNQPAHYLHHLSAENAPLLHLKITEKLKPDLYNNKYIAEVTRTGKINTHGKILILSPADSSGISPLTGDLLLVSSTPAPIPAARNPHQFNYRFFMENRGIMRQLNLRKERTVILKNDPESITTLAAAWRDRIVSDLRESDFKGEELALIQALLLGQRQDISPETYSNFAAAGVIHILAVSGLHVGIILFLLHWLLSSLDRSKEGKIIKTLILITLLWGFAVLAGLSPSVVRAVTMFSFLAIGLQINRRSSALNSLFLSLMVLVLIRPQFLFEVGFQLSYLAVISIILFQPLIAGLWQPDNRILRYFWGILSVTIAAQAGVLPLSLYYFHQFPGLFFLSNLVILPFLGIILGLGILVILLSLLKMLPEWVGDTYERIIQGLIDFVTWTAGQEGFLFQNLSISLLQVILLYLVLFTIFLAWKRMTYKNLTTALISIGLLQVGFIYETTTRKTEELIIFQKSRSTLIGQKKKEWLKLHSTNEETPVELGFIQAYISGEKIEKIRMEPLKNVYLEKGKLVLLIDSTGIYPQDISPHYLLFSGSPRINLERVLQEIEPDVVIADGNNFRSLIARWKATCEDKGIPFYSTSANGAYRIY